MSGSLMTVKRAAQDEELQQGSAKKVRREQAPRNKHVPFFGEKSEAARAKRWRDRFKAADEKAALDVLEAGMPNLVVAAPSVNLKP